VTGIASLAAAGASCPAERSAADTTPIAYRRRRTINGTILRPPGSWSPWPPSGSPYSLRNRKLVTETQTMPRTPLAKSRTRRDPCQVASSALEVRGSGAGSSDA
jgi:hypothetical protein